MYVFLIFLWGGVGKLGELGGLGELGKLRGLGELGRIGGTGVEDGIK